MNRTNTTKLNLESFEERLTPAMTYHAGAVMPHVEAQSVFMGSDYTASAAARSEANALTGYVNYIVNSPYMDALTRAGYGVGRGTSSGGIIANYNLNKGFYLTEADVRAKLQNLISNRQIAQPDANRLYVVFAEPGVAVMQVNGDTSQHKFLAFHGAAAGRDAYGRPVDIRYVIVPHPGGYNPTPASQGFANAFDELTDAVSHELAEAVTDPDVNYKRLGWYDSTRQAEIGDLSTHSRVRLNGYEVQEVVDRNERVLPVYGSYATQFATSAASAPAAGANGGFAQAMKATVAPSAFVPAFSSVALPAGHATPAATAGNPFETSLFGGVFVG